MHDVYEFTSVEVTKLLYEELIRRGKKFPSRCGLLTIVNHSFGKMDSVQIKVTEPVPGAVEI